MPLASVPHQYLASLIFNCGKLFFPLMLQKLLLNATNKKM